ncbi:putative monooxygenase [Xylariaceae sp. FL0255]|nr:putative monooxygenase [Xylariaceae sp. FL0255]
MSSNQKNTHFLSGKRIVVAGAGISGLAFALAIRKSWDPSIETPSITIYDRDTREAGFKREGYTLSLSGADNNGGLYTLKQLGLLDETMDVAVLRADGQGSFTMWTSEFKPLLSIRPKPPPELPTGGIRIRRKDLRRILIDAVSTTTEPCWGTACVSANRLDDGRVQVKLVNQETKEETFEECDLLIAADGASSKVRAAIRPNDHLQFTGAVQMGGNAQFPEGIPSPLDISWGTVLTGTGQNCFFSPVDEHSLVWAISTLSPIERSSYDSSDASQVQAMLREASELGKTMTEPFKTIVEATDPATTFVLNARDKEPFPHDATTGSIIFIGDSNHAVSPFAGFGANLALKDGLDLAQQLCRSQTLQKALTAYDKLRVPLAKKTLQSSHWRIKVGHVTGVQFWTYRIFFGFAGMMLQLLGK